MLSVSRTTHRTTNPLLSPRILHQVPPGAPEQDRGRQETRVPQLQGGIRPSVERGGVPARPRRTEIGRVSLVLRGGGREGGAVQKL